MNKCIYIGFLFLLMACQKEGIVSFNQAKDCIQFNYNLEKNEMTLDYNFAFQYNVVPDQWGYPSYVYLGDSIFRDTISLHLSLMGHVADVDREFRLRTVPIVGLDTIPLASVEFYSSYTFKANQLKDTIQIVLLRPEKRGKYAVRITFDLEDENSAFALGAEEYSIYELMISDRYDKPSDWDRRVDYVGEFSEEKYAFMITVLHVKFGFWNDWGTHNQILRDALEKFNNEHPNNPKDFTFPVNTSPIW